MQRQMNEYAEEERAKKEKKLSQKQEEIENLRMQIAVVGGLLS